MFRMIVAAARGVCAGSSRLTGRQLTAVNFLQNSPVAVPQLSASCRFSYLCKPIPSFTANIFSAKDAVTQKTSGVQIQPQSRTLIKFSLRKGKRKTVKAVIRRFYRLNWGGWIRTRAGRHKRLWTKRSSNKRLLRQHVFCNGTQSYLLDKMVNRYWRKPKFYVDDPYEPYHSREEFLWTRKKPHPY